LRESRELFKGFPISAEDIVLDVGCGDGNYIKFCASLGAEVIFADIDENKVNAVSQKLEGIGDRAARPLVSDGNPLPLSNETATKIVAMEVMEHVDDPEVFLRELVRVGRRGAQYLITVPDPIGETLQKSLAPPEYFSKPNHIRIIQREELDALVQGAGLVLEHKTYYGFYWCLWWLMFWTADGDLDRPPPPLLKSWGETWHLLLKSEQGAHVKRVLDDFMPKSQVVIARKP
jgi:SAM-dependent methyltransferase